MVTRIFLLILTICTIEVAASEWCPTVPESYKKHMQKVDDARVGKTAHDRRLTNFICDNYSTCTHLRPDGEQLMLSLEETTKTVEIPLDIYGELFEVAQKWLTSAYRDTESSMKTFGLKGNGRLDDIQNLRDYLQEQYDLNTRTLTKTRVFKADILVMFRVASGGKPHILSNNLYGFYQKVSS